MSQTLEPVAPLHERLSREIGRQISTAVLPAGSALPSERELCEAHKVSRNTVRQAMQNLQARGLIARVPGKGSFVAFRSAGGDRAGSRSNEVAFFVAREAHADSTLAGIHHGLEQGFHEQGFHEPDFHLISLINGSVEAEKRNLRYLCRSGLGGAIVFASAGYDRLEQYFELRKAGLPFVLVHRSLPGIDAHLVRMDDRRGSYLLTRHLLEQGHRRIAYMFGRECSVMRDRFEGYRDALADFKLPYDPALKLEITAEEARGAVENGQRMVNRLIAERTPFTAIHAAAASLAEGASIALGEAGLTVGEDVAMVGFENIDQWSTNLFLTTTDVAQEQIGKVAARTLRDLMEKRKPAPPTETILPTQIVIRDSSSCPLKQMRRRRHE